MTDPVSVRRIKAGLVRAYAVNGTYGLSVYVEPFAYRHNGVDQYWAGGTVNLTSYLPGSTKWRWVKICLNPESNTPVVLPGTAIALNVSLTEEMLRQIDARDYIPLGGVRLRGTATSISSETDFVDLRPWWSAGAEDTGWYWDVDLAPLSTGTLDDEFSDGTISGWTEYDESGIQTPAEASGELSLTQTAQTAARLTGMYKTIPSGDFTISAKVKASLDQTNGADLLLAGLCLFENAAVYTGDAILIGLIATPTLNRIGYALYDDSNDSYSLAWDSVAFQWNAGDYVYFRLRRSGTTYYVDYGTDGKHWHTFTLTVGFTPGHVGLGLLNENASGAFALTSAFFRSRDVADSADTFLYGAPTFDIATSFIGLLDVPASYAGAGGKVVAVKGTEDGLEFVNAASGGSSGLSISDLYGEVVIADQTLTANGNFDFQNLPQTYDHLKIYAFLRRSSGTSYESRFYFNNDTTDGNYRVSYHTYGTDHQSNNLENAELLPTPDPVYLTGIWSKHYVDIPFYATAGHYKYAYHNSYHLNLNAGPSNVWNQGRPQAMIWKNTAAISRITLTCGTGGFLAGSRVIVTGVGRLVGTINAIANRGARVRRSTNQTIANATMTAVSFDTERWDTDAIWDSSQPTRLTCKTAGVYVITGHVRWDNNTGGTYRLATIRLNGTTEIARQTGVLSAYGEASVSTVYKLAVNDYVELCVYQDSGGDRTLETQEAWSPEFAMQLIAAT